MSKSGFKIPLVASRVFAGFPNPASEFIESTLDLNEHLIKHPSATFFVRVAGDSMTGAGIFQDDILIVDRAVPARNRSVIVANIDGEFTVKRLLQRDGQVYLEAANPRYKPISIPAGCQFEVWGTVIHVIHTPRT